jgi:restriction system protein
MTKNEATVWGIHAGKTGDADTLFLKKHFVALGWEAMGDLSALAPDREAFKARVQKLYPDAKPGAIRLIGGQNYRFVHEAQTGDLIAYPSKHDKKIHVGRIEGPYRYDPSLDPGYPSLRPVKWLHSQPRTEFSQGALYEIGSAMSFFQIKTYAEEFIAVSAGENPEIDVKQDPTVALVASEVEQSTKDYLLKTLSQNFKGHRFAHLVGDLLETMGYRTSVSAAGPDKGIDIVAFRDELGLHPPIIKVQVKSGEGSVGRPEVQALSGAVGDKGAALFVTLAEFTNQARDFAEAKGNIRLLDGDALLDLLMEHYEELDARYRAEIPLKRVYIPEPTEEAGE